MNIEREKFKSMIALRLKVGIARFENIEDWGEIDLKRDDLIKEALQKEVTDKVIWEDGRIGEIYGMAR